MENKKFLSEQIITYLGNKRRLLKYIENEIIKIQKKLNKTKTTNVDLFSGSGVVARLFKKYSKQLIVNDLETYSFLINDCYLTNKQEFDFFNYLKEKEKLFKYIEKNKIEGLISKYYAPKNNNFIRQNERVFFTRENALFIDTAIKGIEELINPKLKKFFLAPLIVEASIKNNTAGVFKGFYKDKNTRIGKFGGTSENALARIKAQITLNEPILSNFNCKVKLFQKDANELVKEIKNIDILYIDPPYNQHPYGSNYFMLNVIANNKLNSNISKISGIPIDWNRSVYNKKRDVKLAFEDLIKYADSKFIIISYNSEGFLSIDQIKNICKKYGIVEVKYLDYVTYRASRNLNKRNLYLKEYLVILEKGVFKNENKRNITKKL